MEEGGAVINDKSYDQMGLNLYMGRFSMSEKLPNPGLFFSGFGRWLWLSGPVNSVFYQFLSHHLNRENQMCQLLVQQKYGLLNLVQALTIREVWHFEDFLGQISLPSLIWMGLSWALSPVNWLAWLLRSRWWDGIYLNPIDGLRKSQWPAKVWVK